MGGRYNPPGVAALYAAGTPTLAVAENLRLATVFGVSSFPPRLLVTLEVELGRVVDLRRSDILASLGLTEPDLFAEWSSAVGVSKTQDAGLALAEQGVEGLIAPSMIERGSANLVVFVRNVDLSAAVRVVAG